MFFLFCAEARRKDSVAGTSARPIAQVPTKTIDFEVEKVSMRVQGEGVRRESLTGLVID